MNQMMYSYTASVQQRAGLLFNGPDVGNTMTIRPVSKPMGSSQIMGSIWLFNDPNGTLNKTPYGFVIEGTGPEESMELGLLQYGNDQMGYRFVFENGTTTTFETAPFVDLDNYDGWYNLCFLLDFSSSSSSIFLFNGNDIGFASVVGTQDITGFIPQFITLDLADVYDGSGLAQVFLTPVNNLDRDNFKEDYYTRFTNNISPYSLGRDGETMQYLIPWVYLSFMDKGGQTTGLYNDANNSTLDFEDATNYERSTKVKVAIPGRPGNNAKVVFTPDESAGYFALEKQGASSTIALGRRIIFSAFYWVDTANDSVPLEINLGLDNENHLIYDQNVKISMCIKFNGSGVLDNVSSQVRVETAVGGSYTSGDAVTHTINGQVNFASTGGNDTALRDINHRNKKPLWVYWTLNIEDTASFRIFLNSCLVKTTKTEAASTYTFTSPSKGCSYGGSKTNEFTSSMHFAHQWLASTNAVIDDDFRYEFVDENDNYIPKDLGTGTVSGIPPLYYFACQKAPEFDDKSLSVYGRTQDTNQIHASYGTPDTARWYGQFDEYYALAGAASAAREVYVRHIAKGAATRGATKMFMSCWALNIGTSNRAHLDLVRWSGSGVTTNSFIGARRGITSSQDKGNCFDTADSQEATMTHSSASYTGDWEHIMSYIDYSNNTGYLYIDRVLVSVAFNISSGSAPNPNGAFAMFREGTDEGYLGVSHFFKEDIIDLNSGVDWANGATMLDLFSNTDGTMPDPGLGGETNLGFPPDIFIQPSLGFGTSGLVNAWEKSTDNADFPDDSAEMVLPYAAEVTGTSRSFKAMAPIEIGGGVLRSEKKNNRS